MNPPRAIGPGHAGRYAASPQRGEATCFSVAADPDMPRAEVVASALLQLKNNPRLFEKWRKMQGYPFKANGKRFKNADLVGW